MNIQIEYVLIGLLVMVLNVLDSVTTNLAFRQYPDKELKGEANPFMRKLMLKSSVLAEVFKHGFVLIVVIWAVLSGELATMRVMALILCLVVANNTFVVVSRAITKRKVITPIEKLRRFLHMPDKYTYAMVIGLIGGLAMIINGVLGGG